MNKLYSYLSTRLGKKTCPIKAIQVSFNFGFNDPFKETLIISYSDGTTEEFIEKPKYDKLPTRPKTLDR
jgi:hypothetical protein